ncbi:probable cytochrome P450 4p3 isoform X2 [Musca autumnalis]|uniref:probable cytochrome P450 4p3 isoform X2 n=1 Tax=Musca autumnalis TaxID=221902 RepID=UPI003CEBD15A
MSKMLLLLLIPFATIVLAFFLIKLNQQMFQYSRNFAKTFKRSYIQYFLLAPVYNVIDAREAELVLNDSRMLTKGFIYTYLRPFLKTGLLTSTDKKWHTRRRLLTPAFHFNILAQFMETFKSESSKFINNLNGLLEKENSNGIISLSELIPRVTLNNVCETALGVCLDERLDGDEYRQGIAEVEESFLERLKNPLKAFNTIYYNSTEGKKYLKSMNKLHAFSSGIIEKRRELLSKEIEEEEESDVNRNEIDENSIYRKRRYAMLDTLLRAEKDGLIDHEGICEEVDTFMFEGFDTTSMNLIFALMSLALYPEMQKKCYEELQEHIPDNDLSSLDIQQLNNLKYLDCFIKETQRLYPSVPSIIRKCTSDIVVDGKLLFPKGTQIMIHIYDIHTNPKYYDEPEKFNPERFMAPQADKRHPFAFIPFSGGQRNCIGQKFALIEMKTLLIYVLKNFVLESVTCPEDFRFHLGLLIRTKTNIQIRIRKRVAL